MFNIFSKNQILYLFLLIFILTLIISCFSPQILSNTSNSSNSNVNDKFIWPLPGYTYISSYFGNRTSPTAGASKYHSGIDIPAMENTSILAVCSGQVTFASWGAGGGYTIVIQNNNISVSYCHVSPNFLVSKGQNVISGNTIAYIGPKNVYNIINNPYKDSNRQSNKWRYNWLSFAFNNKKRRHSRQSIKLF